jgi:predicted TIM-barrel fold metal-dependent hydrolase
LIWDLHCHLSGFGGRTPDERMADMIRFADRMGVDHLCVYMGLEHLIDPSPEQLRRQNDEVLQAISHWHHRAFGFVYLNPNHVQFSLDELNRCVRDGPMVGVKLWVAHRANTPELDPIIERAAALKAVIFQHTWIKTGGNLAGESTPMDLAELARRHPSVPIICGHTGGNWEIGIRAIRGVKNLYSGLAGSDPTAGYVEMAVRELGADRVVYGSDVGGRSFASQLGKVMGAGIPAAARDLILAGNLRRLMLPILDAKGIKL